MLNVLTYYPTDTVFLQYNILDFILFKTLFSSICILSLYQIIKSMDLLTYSKNVNFKIFRIIIVIYKIT
jgi:hypothetical protein